MTTAEITAVVLGSGQDGGVPQFGGPPAAGPERTASSLAIIGDEWAVLVDASPDLRAQQRELSADEMYTPRSSRRAFDAVLLTHAHMGHYAGLVQFGKEAHNADAIPCFAGERMLEFLQSNEPWATLFRDDHLRGHAVRPGVAFEPAPGVSCVAHSVPHRPDFSDMLAFEIRGPRGSLLYVPDIDDWRDWPDAIGVVSGVDVALLDATFYEMDEHPGRDLDAVRHPPVTDTVTMFGGLTASTRIILTHLNWTNRLCDPEAAERAMVTEAGFEVAHDGLRVAL